MRRIAAYLVLLTALLVTALLAGCADGDPRAHAEAPAAPILLGDDARVLRIGRTTTDAQHRLQFSWPASGFVFRFRGTAARLLLNNEPLGDATPANDYILVEIDDTPARVYQLATGRHWYPIGRGISNGDHTVRVRKRTEAEVGMVMLERVELPREGAVLAPPPKRPIRIEAIGDSITAGFGCEGQSPACTFSARTENALATYTALAAERLHAEYSAVAWSGKGVYRNDDSRDLETLPFLYDRSLAHAAMPLWRHSAHPVDVVVINLGTNDCARGDPPRQEFEHAFGDFVAHVREVQPRAFIALILGPMLYDEGRVQSRSTVESVLNSVIAGRRARGDTNIDLLSIWANPAEGVGCQFHPNRRAHARFAQELAAFLAPHVVNPKH